MIVSTNIGLWSQEDGDIVAVYNVERLSFIIRQQRNISRQSQRRGSLLRPYSNHPVNSFSGKPFSQLSWFKEIYWLPYNFTATNMTANARAYSDFFMNMVICQLRPLSAYLIKSARSRLVRGSGSKANVNEIQEYKNTCSTSMNVCSFVFPCFPCFFAS